MEELVSTKVFFRQVEVTGEGAKSRITPRHALRAGINTSGLASFVRNRPAGVRRCEADVSRN